MSRAGRVTFPPHTQPCSRSKHSFCVELLKIARLGSKHKLAHHCLSSALERSPDWRLQEVSEPGKGARQMGRGSERCTKSQCSHEQHAPLQSPPRGQPLNPTDRWTLGASPCGTAKLVLQTLPTASLSLLVTPALVSAYAFSVVRDTET